MFLYPGFESLNSHRDVPPGDYAGVLSVYVDRKSAAKALLSQYTLHSAVLPSIAELQMIDADGQTIRFLDFVLMPDRSWRDSYGLRADHLGRLLPVELASYTFFEQVETGIQTVEKNHV
jgi:hypothetical protein